MVFFSQLSTALHNRKHRYSKPICFIHIPKTAGTSFKSALSKCVGDNKVVLNYGIESEDTSTLFLDNKEDMYNFSKVIRSKKVSAYIGHFQLKHCVYLFSPQNIVTMLRDPVDQVYSHYRHLLRAGSFSGSLRDFVQNRQFQNVQSKYLNGYSEAHLAFVGITEKYDESIKLFNAVFDINMDSLFKNQDVSSYDALSSDDIELIKVNNTLDIWLYSRGLHLFDERQKFIDDKKLWVHGAVETVSAHHISGFAYSFGSESAVKLIVSINGVFIKTFSANVMRPDLRAIHVPRDGYVGFRVDLGVLLNAGDIISVEVADTRQKFCLKVYHGNK